MPEEELIQKVWEKGRVIFGHDPKVWRKDDCEAPIKREEHGNRDSKYGWEIDHINPNGGDSLSNLRPLQWQNNLHKSDGRLGCIVTY
ncbi:HNH endonuclease [Candidatus Woesearchaeota archaeon]|nr:HNH endonuclease [Candidatus Woesearchaeota archaeon]